MRTFWSASSRLTASPTSTGKSRWQDLGWKIIRVSRDLLKFRRSTFVARVGAALRDRG
jgi:hypothetical protein